MSRPAKKHLSAQSPTRSSHRRPLATATAAIALLLAGCISAPSVDESTSAADAPDNIAVASSVTDTEVQDALDAAVNTVNGVGVLATVERDGESWTATAGSRSPDDGAPLTAADHVRAGAPTAAVVGTIVLQLIDENALTLDTRVDDLLTSLDANALGDLTVEDLLRMRTGLGDYTDSPTFTSDLAAQPTETRDPVALAASALELPADTTALFDYSATNALLLALIAEDASGESLTDLVAERIAEPLGLQNTVQPAADEYALPQPHPAALGSDGVTDWSELSASAWWGSGSLVSTTADLATLSQALADGSLLSPDVAAARLDGAEDVARSMPNTHYGLALATYGPLIGHSGTVAGFSTFLATDPETDTTIVVTANSDSRDGSAPASTVASAIIAALYDGLDVAAALPGRGIQEVRELPAGTLSPESATAPEAQGAQQPSDTTLPAKHDEPSGEDAAPEATVTVLPATDTPTMTLGSGSNAADSLIFKNEEIANGTYSRLAPDADELLNCVVSDPGCGHTSLPAWGEDAGYPYSEDAPDVSGQIQLVDFDGDGWPEIFGVGAAYSEIWSYRPMSDQCTEDGAECGQFTPFDMHAFFGLFGEETSVGDVTTQGWITGRTTDGIGSLRVGDFDGDGRDELAGRSPKAPGTIKLIDWDPASQTMKIHAVDTAAYHQSGTMYAGDFDGDGTDEYLVLDGEHSTRVQWSKSHAVSKHNFTTPPTGGIHGTFAVSHVSGMDRLVASAYDRLVSFELESGETWREHGLTSVGSIPATTVARGLVNATYARDLNGDGIDEYVVHLHEGPRLGSAFAVIQTAASSPTGNERHWVTTTPIAVQPGHIRFADLNGNGVVSLIAATFRDELSTTIAHLDLARDAVPSTLTDTGVGTNFRGSAWPLSRTWAADTGNDLMITMHETGVRILEHDGTKYVSAHAAAPAWSPAEQVAYEAISLHVSQHGTTDLRNRFVDTHLHNHDITALQNLRFRDVPAAAGSGEEVFDDVRHALIEEFNAAQALTDYETLIKNEMLTAFSTSAGLGQAVIQEIRNTERATYQAHNDTVDLIDGVIEGALTVATLGNGAVTLAVEKFAEEGLQTVTATVQGLERAGYLSGARSATGVVSSFMKHEVDDTTYDTAAVDVAKDLANTFVQASTAHDAALSYKLQHYSVMMAASHNITSQFWEMPIAKATTYRSSLQREADLYTYSVILPKVTTTWSCIAGGWWPRADCTSNYNPHRDAIYWTGDLKVYLAWPTDKALSKIETSWGWGVPRKMSDKVLATPDPSCTTAWTSSCSFGLDKHDFYVGKTEIEMGCHGLRKTTNIEWHEEDLTGKCLTEKYHGK
ncbi:serine hydrolase [Demequina flava]|uniref:serine hydrolase n=1 Tax=Demequina flava TaxID=1095025 RepID=UPI0007847CF6|nr:serine hydrolase [Demequina flava]